MTDLKEFSSYCLILWVKVQFSHSGWWSCPSRRDLRPKIGPPGTPDSPPPPPVPDSFLIQNDWSSRPSSCTSEGLEPRGVGREGSQASTDCIFHNSEWFQAESWVKHGQCDRGVLCQGAGKVFSRFQRDTVNALPLTRDAAHVDEGKNQKWLSFKK